MNAQIVLSIDNEPEYLDPQIISDSGARTIMSNCMEGLMVWDNYAEKGISCAGAESYDVSADGLTYTFKLREDARWFVTKTASAVLGDNYEEKFDIRVTAKDYVFAFRRALQPETLCPDAGLLMSIKNASEVNTGELKSSKLGVEAISDYVLKITLSKKDSDFIYALTSTACVPCNEEYFNATGGRYGLNPSYMIYNGPFYIANWADNTSISTRRNNTYHNYSSKTTDSSKLDSSKEVYPKSVYYSFNNDIDGRLKKLEDESYHVAWLTESQTQELKTGKKVSINEYGSSVDSIIFNCADEYFSDKTLRLALLTAFDNTVSGQISKPINSVLPTGLYLNGKTASDKLNCSIPSAQKLKAKKYLKDAFENIGIQNMACNLLCSKENETFARNAIQSWQSAFGIIFSVNVEAVDEAELRTRVNSGDYQLALYKIHYTDSFSKTALQQFASYGRNNFSGYNNKKYDKLVENAFKNPNAENIIKAQNQILDDAVIIPICESKSYLGIYKSVENISASPSGDILLFKNVLVK